MLNCELSWSGKIDYLFISFAIEGILFLINHTNHTKSIRRHPHRHRIQFPIILRVSWFHSKNCDFNDKLAGSNKCLNCIQLSVNVNRSAIYEQLQHRAGHSCSPNNNDIACDAESRYLNVTWSTPVVDTLLSSPPVSAAHSTFGVCARINDIICFVPLNDCFVSNWTTKNTQIYGHNMLKAKKYDNNRSGNFKIIKIIIILLATSSSPQPCTMHRPTDM